MNNFKVGDKVWVLCHLREVLPDRTCKVEGSQGACFWTAINACRPVEPVIKDSLTTKSNCPEIPDGSSDPIRVGDAVRFVSPGHQRHGTEGVVTSIGYSGSKYRFDSNCGQFYRWCSIDELKRMEKPFAIKRYREPTLADLVNGPIACEYRDSDDERWRSGFLVHVLNGAKPFLCVNQEQEFSGQWDECRIEVGE